MKQLLNRPFHSAWLICLMAAGVLVGALVARFYLTGFFLSLVWIVIAIVLTIACLRYQRLWCIPLAILAGVIVGYSRGSDEMFARLDINKYYGQHVEISGRVIEDIDRKNGTVRFKLDDVSVNDTEQAGVLWVSVGDNDKNRHILRSDVVEIQGTLQPGFATFNGISYRADVNKIVRQDNADVAREFRDWFAAGVRRVIPEPEASLGVGYIVGQKRGLPNDLTEALMIVGLTHIVVASGYNLTILVRLARRLFEKVSRYMALFASSSLVVAFMFVAGFSPSMTRAGLVAGLSLAVWYYGRKIHPIILLFFAAAISVLINPTYVWGDAGWMLSFSAFAGVLVLAPLLQSYFFGDKKPGVIRQIVGETLSAQLATLPLIIFMFGMVSYVAIFANVLVLPLVPLAMLLVFLCGLLSFIFMPLAELVSIPTTWLLQYMVWVAKSLSDFSWSYQEINVSLLATIAMYVAFFVAIFYLWRSTRLRLEQANIVE